MNQFIYGMNTMGFSGRRIVFLAILAQNRGRAVRRLRRGIPALRARSVLPCDGGFTPFLARLGVFLPSRRVRIADLRGAAKN